MGPDKSGWLVKRGEKIKSWKKRWFVLKNNKFFYYGKPQVQAHAWRLVMVARSHPYTSVVQDKKPKGEIKLEGSSVEFVATEKYKRKFCFEIHAPLQDVCGIAVCTSVAVHVFRVVAPSLHVAASEVLRAERGKRACNARVACPYQTSNVAYSSAEVQACDTKGTKRAACVGSIAASTYQCLRFAVAARG